MDFFKLVADVGFPIAAAAMAGYFVFLTLKFILAGVTSSIKSLSGIITALDNRIRTMNHDIIRIDSLMCTAMNIQPDTDRIARADGKTDARKD
jgi:archaellum biogenesis ATPase FlaH